MFLRVRRVLHALRDDVEAPGPDAEEDDPFWTAYRARGGRREAKLRRVAVRVAPYDDGAPSATTWVDADGVLCFDPTRLDPAGVRREQAAALRCMHARAYDRARFDLSDLTWATARRLFDATTDEDAVAGALLWQCLTSPLRSVEVVGAPPFARVLVRTFAPASTTTTTRAKRAAPP